MTVEIREYYTSIQKAVIRFYIASYLGSRLIK